LGKLEELAEPIGNGETAQLFVALAQRGITLPTEYEAHVRACPALGMSAVIRRQGKEFHVNRLFGGTGVNGLLENFDNASPRRNYVAIGCDHVGNQFLLAHRGKHGGSVWFWDHELDELSRVAGSFGEFLRLLKHETEPGEEVLPKADKVAPVSPRLLAVRVPFAKAAVIRPVLESVMAQLREEGIGKLLGESDEPGTWLWIVRVLADRDELAERIRKALGPAEFQISDWAPRRQAW
jgi:SMI1 / KNR4 family (SUKH-1)